MEINKVETEWGQHPRKVKVGWQIDKEMIMNGKRWLQWENDF